MNTYLLTDCHGGYKGRAVVPWKSQKYGFGSVGPCRAEVKDTAEVKHRFKQAGWRFSTCTDSAPIEQVKRLCRMTGINCLGRQTLHAHMEVKTLPIDGCCVI